MTINLDGLIIGIIILCGVPSICFILLLIGYGVVCGVKKITS